MVLLEDIWTAVDKGYEEIAMLQLDIAKKSRISGDVNIFNKKQMTATALYAYITALSDISFNHNIEDNKIIERLYNNIKVITKDLRQWN